MIHIHFYFQGSRDLSCISELSATEVEELLRSATVHRQVNHHQNPIREGHYLYHRQDDGDRVEGCEVRNRRAQYVNYVLGNNTAEKDSSHRAQSELHYCHQESHYSRQEGRNYHNSLREGHHKRGILLYGDKADALHSSSLVRNCHSVQEDGSASHHTSGFIRSNGRGNGGRPSGCSPPSPHRQKVFRAYQPQPGDYINVDEEERYCYSPHSQTENTALYHSPTSSDRVPSPLFKDDTPYTILNPLDTTEPITAIFMGFQAAQDDSGQSQEFVGSLKAELVIIEDDEQNGEDSNVKKKSHAQPGVSSYSTGRAASEKLECVEGFGDRRTENQMEPGIRKVKKPKPCCTVC